MEFVDLMLEIWNLEFLPDEGGASLTGKNHKQQIINLKM